MDTSERLTDVFKSKNTQVEMALAIFLTTILKDSKNEYQIKLNNRKKIYKEAQNGIK